MYVYILLIFFSIYHIKSGPVGFSAWVATARAFLLVQLPKDDVSRRPGGCDLPKCLTGLSLEQSQLLCSSFNVKQNICTRKHALIYMFVYDKTKTNPF